MESLDRRKQEENQRHHWGGAAVSQLRDAGDLDQGDCIHWGKWKHTNSWGFPGSPVVKTVFLIQRVVVWPLIRDLRSCMLHGMAKCVCVCVYTHVCAGLVAQLCLTLCDFMDYSPPGSSVCGISQARILEWVAISFSMGSFWPKSNPHLVHWH